MRDPRISHAPEDRRKLTLDECRLMFAREVFLALVRSGGGATFANWERAQWSAEQAFPE